MTQTIMGHPQGILVCVMTEIWERFAYYGTLSMLILYLTKSYLLSDVDGNLTVGTVGALLLMSPVVGGVVADRWLGSRKAIMAGCVLMSVGFISISIPASLVGIIGMDTGPNGLPDLALLLLSLAIVIAGNGLVKSSLAEVVGSLYAPGDRRREEGFTYVYWGINLGAVIGPVGCSAIARVYGMRYGFSAAGIGMLIALITFAFGRRYFPAEEDSPRSRRLRDRIAPFLTRENLIYLCAVASIVFFWQLLRMHTFVSGIFVWFGVCLGVFIAYFATRHCERKERDQMWVIGTVVVLTVVYAVVNYQLYGSLILFGDRYVDRNFLGYEISAPMFVSMGAFLALGFTPLMTYGWVRLDRAGLNPNSAMKIGLGVLLTGVSYLVPLLAVAVFGLESKLSLAWIILLAVVLVMGEICLVPVVQSVISMISPRRIVVMMLGSFAFAIGLGTSLAGEVAAILTVVEPPPDGGAVAFEDGLSAYIDAYTYLGIFGIVVGILAMLISPILMKRMHLADSPSSQ